MPPQTISRAPHVGSRRRIGADGAVPPVRHDGPDPQWSAGPADVMRIGAIAVKEYAWYWTMVWRGKKAADGACYDVIDSTQDQLYRPERDPAIRPSAAAVDATWTVSFRKNGRLFATGYRAGSSVACGADANGTILYQSSLYRCARAGHDLRRDGPPVPRSRRDRAARAPATVRATASATWRWSRRAAMPRKSGSTRRAGVDGSAHGRDHGLRRARGTAAGAGPNGLSRRGRHDETTLTIILILQRAGDGRYQIWVAAVGRRRVRPADALVGQRRLRSRRTGRARPLRRGRLHG